MREKEFTNCPICGGIPGTGGLCPNCGFDPGLRYSRYPSLSPLPDGAILRTRRAAWEDRTKGLLRCPKCGGIRFSVLLNEAALRCDACGEKLGQESILKLLPPELAESVKGKEQVDSGRTEEQTAANIEEPAIHWQEDERHLQFLTRRGQKVVTGYTGKVENLVLPTDVTGIAGHAFEGCAGLKNILLPASLTMIGEDAFSGCGALERITLPSEITVLRENCFARCTRLREVILPEGLRRIERNAFCFCGSLKELRLPDSVEEIMEDAFRWTRRDFVLCASGDWIRKHRQSLEKRKILYIPEGEQDKTSAQGDDGGGVDGRERVVRADRDRPVPAYRAGRGGARRQPEGAAIERHPVRRAAAQNGLRAAACDREIIRRA